MRSAAALVTAFYSERLGDFFYIGNSSVLSDTRSNDVLGIYGVISI